jgi:hypothetical protein
VAASLERRAIIVTAGKFFLWFAWSVSIGSQLSTLFADPSLTLKLILFVLTLAISGLIHRLDELERRIDGHVPESEPKPELEPAGNEDDLQAPRDW